MAKLGIVSDEQFNKELTNSSPAKGQATVILPVSPVKIEQIQKGRGLGNVAVPEGLRKLIGEESALYGREKALELANDFGISESSVSAYAKGATSTSSYNKPDQGLLAYLTTRKSRLAKKALHKLSLSLNAIDEDKLKDVKARDLAGIAKDMSVIAKNMEPPNTENGGSNAPQFIVYAPQIRDERSYEQIIVNDNY